MKRRKFLKNSSLSTAGIFSASILSACEIEKKQESINEIVKTYCNSNMGCTQCNE